MCPRIRPVVVPRSGPLQGTHQTLCGLHSGDTRALKRFVGYTFATPVLSYALPAILSRHPCSQTRCWQHFRDNVEIVTRTFATFDCELLLQPGQLIASLRLCLSKVLLADSFRNLAHEELLLVHASHKNCFFVASAICIPYSTHSSKE